jgi:hypothetical protein
VLFGYDPPYPKITQNLQPRIQIDTIV